MLPTEFCERMRTLLGECADAFFAAYDKPRHTALRFNPRKAAAVPALPFGLRPVPWAAHGYYYPPDARPGLHPYHDAGVYYLQEPSAMAPAMLLDAQPGERVLDLCAAPGGKSTQLAAAMAEQGLLVCNEIHPKRAQILSSNIERLGFGNTLVLNETPARLAQRFPGYFDRVLVDAPCSGEGMFRKEAAAVTDWSRETVALCAERQLGILREAAELVRPGGRLVYSTCTFAPEENEGVIGAFLRERPDYEIISVEAPYFAPGHPEWADGNPALAKTYRLWPHLLEGEGHYAAVLRRTDGISAAPCPTERGIALPADFLRFAEATLPPLPAGQAVLFGQKLYLLPPDTPALAGLRVLRAGLELGQLRKGRFEPAHALAHWLDEAAQTESFPADSPEIARYLHGETLPTGKNGWILVQVDGYGLGWGKATAGVLKNHYPKGLRSAF